MASAGLDIRTGAVIQDLDDVRQSFRVIVATRIGTRILARTFGARVVGLLGRNLAAPILQLFFVAIIVAVDLWEPRLRIVQIFCPAPPNAPATLRFGALTMAILADYRPYALAGDTATDVQQIWV